MTGLEPDAAPSRPLPPRPKRPPPLPPRKSTAAPVTRDTTPAYHDQGMIARGGMGRIHAVIDGSLKRQVAMKQFDPLNKNDPTALERFVEEAQLTSRLDHPNIVPVHALSATGTGPAFFTMKLIRGQDLKQVLEQLGVDRLRGSNLEHLVGIIANCCHALSFAHAQGVLHRDLKPTNVMVGAHGQVYVMDWGLAYLNPEGEIPPQEFQNAIGTPAYMAPEQAWAQPDRLGAHTDVFGLGGLLYAILTGGPPYRGRTPIDTVLLAREGKVPHPQTLVPDRRLPPELCRITMRALSPEPEDRQASVGELRQELEQFQRGGGWLETRRFEAGAVIVEEGAPSHEAFIVVDGTCEVRKKIRGRDELLQTMGAGEVFGETAFLSGGTRQATVVARTEVLLKVVTRESLESELSGKGWLRLFITTLTQRFGELSRELSR